MLNLFCKKASINYIMFIHTINEIVICIKQRIFLFTLFAFIYKVFLQESLY